MRTFKVRDFRNKQFFLLDDVYLNGYARQLDPTTTAVYLSLCRHADKDQICFPSQDLIAEEHNIGRRTVIDKLRVLQDWNIIQVERSRDGKGKWERNTYILLDKSEWKPLPHPSADSAHGQPSANDDTTHVQKTASIHVQQLHTKDTHIIKDTHIKDSISLDILQFGDPSIGEVSAYFLTRMRIPKEDCSQRQSRRYWSHLLRESKRGVEGVKWLIDVAADDPFYGSNITSSKDLYYNRMKLISRKRGKTPSVAVMRGGGSDALADNDRDQSLLPD